MTLSVTRLFGLICTYAVCDVSFPPATVPEDPPVVISHRGFARGIGHHNNFYQHLPPTVSLADRYRNITTFVGYHSKTVRGRRFSAFEGIPFAEPPIGNLRYKDPERSRLVGRFEAVKKSSICMQMDPLRFYNVIGQEDCLYLNVYTEDIGHSRFIRKRPVMIWVHGGSFYHGSGNHYGPAYLMDKDIVLVTFNYRLGSLGFLSTGDDRLPGNIGLKDQAMAIDWVYNNIEAFGGDRSRITLFGQSAGAASTHIHMMSQRTKWKLFSGISQSGSAFCHWVFAPYVRELTEKLVVNVGCSDRGVNLVDCLRSIPAKTLVSAQYDLFKWMEYPQTLFGPVIEHNHENALLSAKPEVLYETGQVANIPWITGVTKDEGDLFSLLSYLGPFAASSLLKSADSAIPTVLMYNESDTDTTDKIKKFYLGSLGQPSLSGYESLQGLGRMLGDLFFYVPFHKSMEYHSKWTSAPVYGYFLSHKGDHGVPEKFLLPTAQWGVMHLDDIQYLFNSTEYFYPQSPQNTDYNIVDQMTTLWTNFALTGIPFYDLSQHENEISLADVWEQFRMPERRILDIGLNPFMRGEPYQYRINFWKHTPYY